MALPKFEKSDGTGPLIFEEFPSLPGDRADLTIPVNFESFPVEHKRNEVIVERRVITTKFLWNFFFKNVSVTMVENFRTFAQLGLFRFYPDSANAGLFYDVHWISKFRSILQRGGTYNLSVTLIQK